MSDYTIKNFQTDVENSASGRMPDGLEARFGRGQIDSEHLGVSYFKYAPDFRTPFGHSHREQEEVYVVISGGGQIKLGDEVVELKQWDIVRCAPQLQRAFAAGSAGMELIAVGNDRPEGGDGEMVQDFWKD